MCMKRSLSSGSSLARLRGPTAEAQKENEQLDLALLVLLQWLHQPVALAVLRTKVKQSKYSDLRVSQAKPTKIT